MSRVLLVFLTFSLTAQNRLTPAEERGRQIYERGSSASGTPIEALIAGNSRVPGSILPCANCHGRDGLGRPEGGVAPSNITWDALSKPYGLTHPDGRSHAAYNERLLRRAITMGIDPAGNTLANAMPRFQLSLTDASDLVTYIKRLGGEIDPGLTGTSVRIGVILPPASVFAEAGEIARRAVIEYFSRLNDEGGIFGRKVQTIFIELPPNRSQRAGAVREFLRDQQIFSVMGPFTSAEAGISGVMSDTETPDVAAIAPFSGTGPPPKTYAFYLAAGVKEEMNALVDFATTRFPGEDLQWEIASSGEKATREAADWLRERLRQSGRRKIEIGEDVQLASADLVFWLRPVPPSTSVIASSDRNTTILIPASFIETPFNFSPILNIKIFTAVGPGVVTEGAESSSAGRLIWSRVTASAAIVAEAMRHAGRGLSRASILQALEGFRELRTNLPFPVSFGPDRRIGATGVRIMTLDPQSRRMVPADVDGPLKSK